MSDSLRDRIAAALKERYDGRAADWLDAPFEEVADAVIAELGLTYSCQSCGGWGPDHE